MSQKRHKRPASSRPRALRAAAAPKPGAPAPKSDKRTRTARITTACSLGQQLAVMVHGASLKRLDQLLKYGAVSVNQHIVKRGDHLLEVGDEVAVHFGPVHRDRAALPHGLRVVFEDEHLVVVEKPSGLLTVGTERERSKTAHSILCSHVAGQGRSRGGRVFVVHRLDQHTSGLLVFAKTEEVKHALQEAWSGVHKEYYAVVEGIPEAPSGTLESHLSENQALTVYSTHEGEGRLAITHYRVLEAVRRGRVEQALLQVRLETGRKHQIRVHLAELGTPVVGDRRYGAVTAGGGRLGLHACYLAFTHPVSQEPLEFSSPLPVILEHLLRGERSGAGEADQDPEV